MEVEVIGPFKQALVFFINATLGIYIFLIMLRFLLNYFRTGFRDAPSQFILHVTHPPLKMLYNLIPGWRGIDFAALFLMLVLQMLKRWLTFLIYLQSTSVPQILLWSLMDLLLLLLQIFFWAIIIQVIFNWIALISNNHSFYNTNPLSHILYHITEPLLAPVRRQLRSWGVDIPGVDVSPLIVSIVLWTGIIFLSQGIDPPIMKSSRKNNPPVNKKTMGCVTLALIFFIAFHIVLHFFLIPLGERAFELL